MGRKNNKTRGLYRREGSEIWQIDKVVRGRRICESTGESDLKKAEEYLAKRIEEVRQASVYGIRPKRTFRQAATKYLNEKEKATLAKDAWSLKRIDPFIGSLPLEAVHMGTLRSYIEYGKQQDWKNRTINMPLEVVRHILNLAASEWLDEYGMTWLQTPPKIRLLPRSDAREPHPLQWEEQNRLFNSLPPHLLPMCLFAVNTGLRDSEVCGPKWEWEQEIPELGTSVFIIPKEHVKNREDRLVVLNRISQEIIRQQRGIDPVWVFTYQGHPIQRITNTGWKNARASVGLSHVHEHDLKHTFGRRLRAAGVSFEDRQALLGHKSGRITTHYSAPEIANLIDAANKVCAEESRKSPALVILRKKIPLRLVVNRAG